MDQLFSVSGRLAVLRCPVPESDSAVQLVVKLESLLVGLCDLPFRRLPFSTSP